MGVVLKGRDPDLGRDLAVKVLLEAHRENPDLVRRFVEEAQIGRQLQHPRVVPIYDLGTFGEGRPYFTMKLVKGQTLSELLAERKSPADELPRFLEIFQQVCQTMAYAHARDVIHRDLNPLNCSAAASIARRVTGRRTCSRAAAAISRNVDARFRWIRCRFGFAASSFDETANARAIS
jgi:serine/threonine protein kinase